jgi:hypothetical protein
VRSAGDREEPDSDEFETCPSWGPGMDTAAVAPIILKTISVHGSITVPFGATKVRNESRLGRHLFLFTYGIFGAIPVPMPYESFKSVEGF